jgi:hypothetical protein
MRYKTSFPLSTCEIWPSCLKYVLPKGTLSKVFLQQQHDINFYSLPKSVNNKII